MNAVFESPAIVWPKPIINSASGALEDASCMIERLRTLLKSNGADFDDAFLDPGAALSEYCRMRAASISMIYTIAEEKLAEIDSLICEINEKLLVEPATSVGRHVAIAKRCLWSEAVNAYKAAEAVPPTGEADDAKTCDAAAGAFMRMVKTRSPDLRALHEKMCLCKSGSAFHTDGVIDALFDDVEHLVRRYERDAVPATSVEY